MTSFQSKMHKVETLSTDLKHNDFKSAFNQTNNINKHRVLKDTDLSWIKVAKINANFRQSFRGSIIRKDPRESLTEKKLTNYLDSEIDVLGEFLTENFNGKAQSISNRISSTYSNFGIKSAALSYLKNENLNENSKMILRNEARKITRESLQDGQTEVNVSKVSQEQMTRSASNKSSFRELRDKFDNEIKSEGLELNLKQSALFKVTDYSLGSDNLVINEFNQSDKHKNNQSMTKLTENNHRKSQKKYLIFV